jgi:hypothetical protein
LLPRSLEQSAASVPSVGVASPLSLGAGAGAGISAARPGLRSPYGLATAGPSSFRPPTTLHLTPPSECPIQTGASVQVRTGGESTAFSPSPVAAPRPSGPPTARPASKTRCLPPQARHPAGDREPPGPLSSPLCEVRLIGPRSGTSAVRGLPEGNRMSCSVAPLWARQAPGQALDA